MNCLLDASILSEIWRPLPDPKVLAWFLSSEWLLPAPVIAEIQEGIEATPSAAKRIELNRRLDEILRDNPEIVLPWDLETARMWGRLKHSKEVKNHPQSLWDSLIDAMGVRYDIPIATRNKKDFRHARTFSPWDDSEDRPAEARKA